LRQFFRRGWALLRKRAIESELVAKEDERRVCGGTHLIDHRGEQRLKLLRIQVHCKAPASAGTLAARGTRSVVSGRRNSDGFLLR
jgi:hypothetical protein